MDAGRGLGINEGDSQDGPSEDRQDARRGRRQRWWRDRRTREGCRQTKGVSGKKTSREEETLTQPRREGEDGHGGL